MILGEGAGLLCGADQVFETRSLAHLSPWPTWTYLPGYVLEVPRAGLYQLAPYLQPPRLSSQVILPTLTFLLPNYSGSGLQ